MKPFPVLSRAAAYAIVIALWAAIYLPGLGSIEIKGEEIRRIMPGINMLESGNWIVPTYNGNTYLRKPPLVNWAIALSVRSLRARNEWTVRLPSVLAMLAMALVMLAACGPWLGTNTALAAVIMTLTSAGIVEKGRLAEIEAIYIALFGMAFSCWLGWTAAGRSRWLTWPATGLLLGLGLLAKGPPHLAFFYAIAGFIAWKSRPEKGERRLLDPGLASWEHLCGIAVMLAIFALWWIPYTRDPATAGASGVMARQMEQRIGGGDSSTIFINFARSLVNFLPWVLALPLFWRRSTISRLPPREQVIVKAARYPIVVCAFALMLIPGMLPRYTLPLVIPFSLLAALLLRAEFRNGIPRVPLAAGCLAGAGMITYAIFFAPRVAAHGYSRDFAAQVNAATPPGSTIYIFDPSVQPEIFYIRGKLIYTDSVKLLPEDVPRLLAPEPALKLLRSKFAGTTILAQPREQSGRRFVLVALHGHKTRGMGKPATP